MPVIRISDHPEVQRLTADIDRLRQHVARLRNENQETGEEFQKAWDNRETEHEGIVAALSHKLAAAVAVGPPPPAPRKAGDVLPGPDLYRVGGIVAGTKLRVGDVVRVASFSIDRNCLIRQSDMVAFPMTEDEAKFTLLMKTGRADTWS